MLHLPLDMGLISKGKTHLETVVSFAEAMRAQSRWRETGREADVPIPDAYFEFQTKSQIPRSIVLNQGAPAPGIMPELEDIRILIVISSSAHITIPVCCPSDARKQKNAGFPIAEFPDIAKLKGNSVFNTTAPKCCGHKWRQRNYIAIQSKGILINL